MNERKGFLLVLLSFLGFVTYLMMAPYLSYIAGAAILAFMLRKPYHFLRDRAGPNLSAGLLVTLSVFLAVVPVLGFSSALAEDASVLAGDIRNGSVDFGYVESLGTELLGTDFDLKETASSTIRSVTQAPFSSFAGVVSIVASLSVGLPLMLFLEFYLIRDGSDLVEWVIEFSPLPEDTERELIHEVSLAMSAVLRGHILVAVAQGAVAGLGLLAFGIEAWAFWTFVMILLSVIPLVGSVLVWFPAAVYLSVSGNSQAGILLALYGFTVVSLTDNVLRPFLVEKGSDLSVALIVLGLFGGITLMGPIGIFIGPVILSLFRSVSNVFVENYEDL